MEWYDLEKSTREDVRERIEYDDSDFDIAYEVADGMTPVYTADLLSLALDRFELATSQYNEFEEMVGTTTAIDMIRSNTFYALAEVAHDELQCIQDEREEMETDNEIVEAEMRTEGL